MSCAACNFCQTAIEACIGLITAVGTLCPSSLKLPNGMDGGYASIIVVKHVGTSGHLTCDFDQTVPKPFLLKSGYRMWHGHS